MLKTKISEIIRELSYRVNDGIPNLNNEQHLIKLFDVLKEFKWPVDARVELIKTLTEDDEWWTKMSPEQQADYIKKHPKSQKAQDAKEKEDGEESEVSMSNTIDRGGDSKVKNQAFKYGYKEIRVNLNQHQVMQVHY